MEAAAVGDFDGLAISPLRGAGIALGVAFFVLVFWRARRSSWARFHLLLWSGVAAGLVVVSALPGLVSVVFGPFSLDEGEGFPRLVGLLVAAVLFLLGYQLYVTSNLESGRRELTSLVRALAVSRYLDEVGDAQSPDVLVVIPAYNEDKTLPSVLAELPASLGDLTTEHVVVVDGATDRTEEVARRFGIPAVHQVNRGQTAALLTGYEIAKRRGAHIVATIDADGQMVPDELAQLVAPVAEDRADLASGSRVLGTQRAASRVRSLGVRVFGLLLTALIRQRVTDTSVGMRAIRVSSLEQLRLREERFGAAELLVEAHRRGLRIEEVPVTIRARAGGETRKPSPIRYGLNFAYAMIRSWLR
jgi:hypothetical protein